MKQMTLAESMALAVLRGDLVAAYALADQLTEERLRGDTPLDKGYREIHDRNVDGHEVYHWPEFQAFAKRLGLLWDLSTKSITIRLCVDESVQIHQEYIGRERNQVVDTTSAHNEEWRTSQPVSGEKLPDL